MESLKNKKKKKQKLEREYFDTKDTMNEYFDTCNRYCEEKISLADQTYEIIENHIKKIDYDVSQLERELEVKEKEKKSKNKKKLFKK